MGSNAECVVRLRHAAFLKEQVLLNSLFLTANLTHTKKTAKNLPCFLNSAGGFIWRIL